MAQCEECETWQHGRCMGFGEEADLPEHYYCELCRPDLYVDLLRCVSNRTVLAGRLTAICIQETCQTSSPGIQSFDTHPGWWTRLSHVALTVSGGTLQTNQATQHHEQSRCCL